MDETHLLNPTDVNGINKISGELYHLVYHSVYGIRACSLRLTNTYGPRQLIRHNRQGFIGWFVRKAVLGEEIQIFGDGRQRRDFDYVDDVVDALPARRGASTPRTARCFNLGGEAPGRRCSSWRRLLIEMAGRGSYRLVPFPARAQAHRHRRLLRRHRQDPRVLGWAAAGGRCTTGSRADRSPTTTGTRSSYL